MHVKSLIKLLIISDYFECLCLFFSACAGLSHGCFSLFKPDGTLGNKVIKIPGDLGNEVPKTKGILYFWKMKRVKLTLLILSVLFFIWFITGLVIWINVKVTNWRRLSEIENANPGSYRVFSKFIDDIEANTGWNVLIISGLRSREKQKELMRENSKNASADKSRHVLGRAIDINLYQKNWLWRVWLKKYNSKKDWRNSGVVRISDKYGLRWGGAYDR